MDCSIDLSLSLSRSLSLSLPNSSTASSMNVSSCFSNFCVSSDKPSRSSSFRDLDLSLSPGGLYSSVAQDQIQETDKPSRFVVEAENKAIVEDAVPITQGENILDNSRIMKLMTNMGYKKGKGLGRRSEGPPTFVLDIEIRQQNHTYGLGYRSTAWDDFKQKQLRIAKARAKKEDVPFDVPMSPYPRTLNGRFTRAGDVFPFWGFRSPVVIATGWDV